MKNIHKIFSSWNDIQIIILGKYGIKVEEGYDSFILEENETYWQLKPYFNKWHVKDDAITQFSDEDLNNASLLVLRDVWVNGYPMPDGDNGFKNTTYDDNDYCNECGIGLVQHEPFRLKKEPVWGNKKMFSLNWVYDEFLVRKDYYEDTLKKYGINAMPVLLFKKETVIEDTVQLIIPTTPTPLQLDGYSYEVCKTCNRKRFNLVNKGIFPSFETKPKELHLFKSNEYFGTGANARKYVFVSSELRSELLKAKIKANYIPCSGNVN